MVVQYKQAGGAGIAGSTSNNAIIRNSYNIGRIETKFVAYATLTAYSGKSQNNIFENNYFQIYYYVILMYTQLMLHNIQILFLYFLYYNYF